MKPFIHVKFENGLTYQVPTSIIVQDRAACYHERDKDEFPTIEDAIKDSEELFAGDAFQIEDWARNNMNWEGEIKPHSKVIGHEPIAEDWMTAELSYHDKDIPIEPLTSGDGILEMPVSYAMLRMAARAASNNFCHINLFSGPDGQRVAALAMIYGGPKVVEFYLGGLNRLSETITEAANGSLDAPTQKSEQQ